MEMQDIAKAEQAWYEATKQLVGQRITIEYGQTNDLVSTNGTKRGWLVDKDGTLMLIPKSNSKGGYRLTGGMFDGFYATLTVRKITA